MTSFRLLPLAALAALVLLAAAPAPTQAQDAPAWQRVALDANVSAEFPAVPTTTVDHGGAGLQAVSPGGKAVYVVYATPSGLAANASDSARTAFYRGALGKAPIRGRLVSERPVAVGGAPGLEFVYTSTTKLGEVTNTNRVVALGSTAYFFMTGSLTATEARQVAERERFFGSIRTAAGSADEASAAATAASNAPAKPKAASERPSLFTSISIVAGLLGGLGAMWLIRRRAQATKPNA